MLKDKQNEIYVIRKTLRMSRPAFAEVCLKRSEQSVIKYERGEVTPPEKVMKRARKWINLYNEIHRD